MVLIALVITVVGLVAVNFGWLRYLKGRDERDREERWGILPPSEQTDPVAQGIAEEIAEALESVEEPPDELELVGTIQPTPEEKIGA